ncbi:MAG: GNAT family N-acetyltransferase [Bacteriovoracaceae bacterium]|jgi:uncharacterized protein|nr:GNAT family N-acetyltransferase [Bacteriovoracaceae bacterium]
MDFKIEKFKTANDFLFRNEEHLLKSESINNLILGLACGIQKSEIEASDPLFLSIIQNGKLAGQALLSNPSRPLVVSRIIDGGIIHLCEFFKKENITLKGVVGPSKPSSLFSKQWSSKTNLGMHQGIYELLEVKLPKNSGGELVFADERDLDKLTVLVEGFVRDCFPEEQEVDKRYIEILNRQIRNKTLYVWKLKSGEIVSMAAVARESKNAATISMVFTPEHHRGNGYGSLVTAYLSKRVLESGKKKCNLFTDLLNPTSNSIYRKIGYKKIGESMHYHFI